MPAHAIDLCEATSQLDELVEEAARGGEVILTRAGEPVARILAIPGKKPQRQFGSARGLITFAPDFDEPLDDFAPYR